MSSKRFEPETDADQRHRDFLPDGHEPGRAAKAVRFGCGAALGLLVGVLVATQLLYEFPGSIWAAPLLSLVICGWLALKYGDRFWRSLKIWVPWI